MNSCPCNKSVFVSHMEMGVQEVYTNSKCPAVTF